jgi:hypothetical protein
MYIRRQGSMWLKMLLKNVIFTVKTMMWMSTHESAPPWTLQVWKHLLTLLASYSMLGLLKRSMSLVALYSCDCWREVWVWWLCILMIDEFGGSVFSRLMSLVALYSHDWYFKLLVMASCCSSGCYYYNYTKAGKSVSFQTKFNENRIIFPYNLLKL